MTGEGEYHGAAVWHPGVHHFFGERLYYLRIACSQYVPYPRGSLEEADPSSPVYQIHDLLGRVGAYGHCIYEVFGDADILARVWLTAERYQSLTKSLTSLSVVDRVEPFLCDSEDYIWARTLDRWREISEDDIAKRSNEIGECASGLRAGNPMMDGKSWRILWDERLILKVVDEQSNGSQKDGLPLKFFSFLRLTPRLLRNSMRAVEQLRTACDEAAGGASDLSIYLGSGSIGNCLLKGTTTAYYGIYDIVASVLTHLDLDEPPRTLLVASRHWHESDDLNPGGATIDMRVRTICAYCLIPFETVARLLASDPKCKAMVEVYEDISPLLSVDEERLLSGFVSGLLDDDEPQLEAGLIYLFRIERDLKPYLLNRLQRSFPGEQPDAKLKQQIRRIRKPAADGQGKEDSKAFVIPSNVNEFTLMNYLYFLGKLGIDEDIAGDLGQNWKKQIQSTIELRNEMAHGRLAGLLNDWPRLMRRVAPALIIYYRLRRIVDGGGWGDETGVMGGGTEQ